MIYYENLLLKKVYKKYQFDTIEQKTSRNDQSVKGSKLVV